MKRSRTAAARLLGAAALMALLLPGLFSLVPQQEALAQAVPNSNAPQDDRAQKKADLSHALANGGVSPDRLIVVYERGISLSDVRRATARQRAGGLLLHTDGVVPRDVIRVPNGDATAVAARMQGLPGVRDAYPDLVVTADMAANDPLMSQQWGLSTIGATAAWDTTLGQSVPVAILDCGIHTSHPDLQGKVTVEQNFSADVDADDHCNHGTHVAGIVGARTNNDVGVASVAPGATFMSGKFLDADGN
jgi:thermitase